MGVLLFIHEAVVPFPFIFPHHTPSLCIILLSRTQTPLPLPRLSGYIWIRLAWELLSVLFIEHDLAEAMPRGIERLLKARGRRVSRRMPFVRAAAAAVALGHTTITMQPYRFVPAYH